MDQSSRFSRLKRRRIGDLELPVATGLMRLLGLALIDRESAGPGLVIPRCRSIHTLGMRFPIHVVFLGEDERLKRLELTVGPGRFLSVSGPGSVVELVPREGDDQSRLAALFGGLREELI